MNRNLMLAMSIVTFAPLAVAQNSQRAAAPSTRATVSVNLTPARGVEGVEPATIKIDYGQPHLRGRRLHTGDLVPLDSIWRFGANESTTLTTGVDFVLGGHRLAKGAYSLYVLPRTAGWKLIVNSNTGQWGTEYDAKYDVVRLDLKKSVLSSPVESFSVWLIPSAAAGAPGGELRFAWGEAALSTDWRVP